MTADVAKTAVDRRVERGFGLDVLGPTVVRVHGLVVRLRRRESDVLAALALRAPHTVPMDDLVDLLWSAPPASAAKTVQNHVARLRTALGRDCVITMGGGYRLGPGWEIDVDRFDACFLRGRRGMVARDFTVGRALLLRALSEIRGVPFEDLPASAATTAERVRRSQMILAAEDDEVLGLLATDETGLALARASALVETEPYRETRWMMLAISLYRSGQRRESLRVLNNGRRTLLEASGLTVGPALARLESLILVDDPVVARGSPFTLVDHAMIQPLSTADDDIFVGRSEQLDACVRILSDSSDHRRSRSITVSGEEGIGKTAFASRLALLAALDGWDVVWGVCWATPSRVLEPVGDVIRSVLEHESHPEDLFGPELLDDLSSLWGDPTEQSTRGHLGDAAVELLCRRADRTPTMIVIDDAQHLSTTAGQILDRLVDHPSPLVVLRLVSGGVSDGTDDAATADTRIALMGLDAAETSTLLETLTGAVVADDVLAAARIVTSGNPMLLRHVTASLGTELVSASAWKQANTAQLWMTVRDRMPPTSQQVGALLALAGGALDPAIIADVLAGTLNGEDVIEACAAGVSSHVFTRDGAGRIDLVSNSLGDVLGRSVDEDDRVELHQRLGQTLERAGASPQSVAVHALAAASRDPQRAIDLACAAAREAFEATMFVEAAELYSRAGKVAALTRRSSDSQAFAVRLGEVECRRFAGDPRFHELAWSIAMDAEAEGNPIVLGRAVHELCRLGPGTRAGSLDENLAALVERAIAGCPDQRVRARAASQASLMYSSSGRVDMCRGHFMDALAIARSLDDDDVLASVLIDAYSALTHPSDWSLSRELAEELLVLGERLHNDLYVIEALHLMFATQIERCDPLLRTTFARQASLESVVRGATQRWQVGYQSACLAFIEGRFDDSIAIVRKTVDDSPADPSRAHATYLLQLFFVRLVQGTGEELAAQIDEVIVDQPGVPAWRCAAAWLAALRGDTDRVRAECSALNHGHRLPYDSGWSGAVMLLGRAVAAIGDLDSAAEIHGLLAPYSGLMTWLSSCTIGPFDLALSELALVRHDIDAARHHHAIAQRCIDRLQATAFQSELDALAAKIALGSMVIDAMPAS